MRPLRAGTYALFDLRHPQTMPAGAWVQGALNLPTVDV